MESGETAGVVTVPSQVFSCIKRKSTEFDEDMEDARMQLSVQIPI